MSRVTVQALGRALTAVLAVTVAGCSSPTPTPTSDSSKTPPRPPPNLVLVLTDDLDILAVEELPRIGDLVANRGLTFNRAFVTQPLCAPSRASILTGQYSHNHGVIDNHPPDGGFPALRRHEGSTIATWLKAAGYRTSLVGKYINDYPLDGGDTFIPPGWDDWHAHLSSFEDGRYFNYWVNDNGTVSRHGAAQEDYSTDVVSQRAVEFIRAAAGAPEPLFLYIAPEAPHVPANYASRHGSAFPDAEAPRVPSFNESDVSDKPAPGRQQSLLTSGEIARLDKLQQWRLRSMLAVEDLVDAVIQALSETARIDNTYIIFTSDNGLLMGQHRLWPKKRNLYEETIRVPLMIRGPGVPVGTVDAPVLNIDLAPTLLELAGAPVPGSVDGRSLAPFLRGSPPSSWRTDVLIENYGSGAGVSLALREPDWLYAEIDTGELELYDMRNDPYQMESLHRHVSPSFLQAFSDRIRTMFVCRGASCP